MCECVRESVCERAGPRPCAGVRRRGRQQQACRLFSLALPWHDDSASSCTRVADRSGRFATYQEGPPAWQRRGRPRQEPCALATLSCWSGESAPLTSRLNLSPRAYLGPSLLQLTLSFSTTFFCRPTPAHPRIHPSFYPQPPSHHQPWPTTQTTSTPSRPRASRSARRRPSMSTRS